MNTAVCAAIKGQEKVAARRWRRRVSPRTAQQLPGRGGAGSLCPPLIRHHDGVKYVLLHGHGGVSFLPGHSHSFHSFSNRQLERRDHKRPDYYIEEATSGYAARSRAGKDGKLKKPKKKKKIPLRMGRCYVGGASPREALLLLLGTARSEVGGVGPIAWGTSSGSRAVSRQTLLSFSKSKQMVPNSQTWVLKK